MDKEEIFEKAHLQESSELARSYFRELGLSFENITISQAYKLSEFITAEIEPLLADKEYHMVLRLCMEEKIKKNKYGIFLFTNGSYFKKREAIYFYNPKTNDRTITIGFCGCASGCNRIPFIKGFIKWCDWMKENGK